ncbi:MAG: hypothetical protein H6709_01870 [Kofleriaceae bacterium]|nr:hypothetical protein [Myxococcales bacterium]MCB9565113.1 hypothetical protein [Kofleriaceae bacterium]MCB9570817.1 hypothetical protein [Kofleriaceae bacterium]
MRSLSVVLVCLVSSSSVALADPDPGAPPATGLRNGFSLSAGQESGGDRDLSATLFGVDWRIG